MFSNWIILRKRPTKFLSSLFHRSWIPLVLGDPKPRAGRGGVGGKLDRWRGSTTFTLMI